MQSTRSLFLAAIGLVSIGGFFLFSRIEIARGCADAPAALAARANAVKWEVSPGSSDLCPPGLRAMQKELIATGPGMLDEIEKSLDHSLNLRRIASSVIQTWPCDRTRALLAKLVRDPDSMAAQEAAHSLGHVGGAEVRSALLQATRHANPGVRHAALNALARHTGYGSEEWQAARRLIGDEHPFVRQSAAGLLGDARGLALIEEGMPILRKVAAGDPDASVRQEAEQGLRLLEIRKAGSARS